MNSSDAADTTRSATRQTRLLVVDDDALSSSFQSHLASLLGFAAVVESDPELAVDAALTGGFDVVLLDLGMPRIDGFEVLRRLRSREARSGRVPMPVIAVTGYSAEADRLRCLMAGFNDHLSKPIQAATLAAALERALAHRGESVLPRSSDAQRLRATVRRLSELKPDDRGFAPTVTESFALRSAQLIDAMRDALLVADRDAAQRAAHALKSSAEFLGALRLAQMAADFDAAAARDDRTAGLALLEAINNEHQAVLTLLFEASD